MTTDWPETTLGDECDLLTGFPFKSAQYTDDSTGVRLVRGDNVVQGRLRWDGVKRWPSDATSDLEQYQLQQNDVVLAMDRPWIEAGLKYAAISTHDLPALLVQRVSRIRGGSNLDTRFLKYLIGSAEFTNHVLSVQTGTAVPHISAGQIKSFTFRRPPVATQRRIAEILGTLDDKVELNRRMNETLVAMARRLFKSWFVDFDPVHAKAALRREHPKLNNADLSRRALPNLAPEIAELFPDSFDDSSLAQLPTRWGTTTLGDESDLLAGYAFKSKSFMLSADGPRLARGDNVKEGEFYWGDKSRYWPRVTPDIQRYVLAAGDVLIGMDGSKVGKNWVRVRVSDLPCLLVQRVTRVRSTGSLGEHFLSIAIGSSRFRDYVDGVKTGTSIPHISLKQISDFGIVRPPSGDNRLFRHFERAVEPLIQRADYNYEQTKVVGAARERLLARLLSGHVRLAQ